MGNKVVENYYLAIDIGASSGTHILGWLEDKEIKTKEIYRFKNKLIERDGKLCWDLESLFFHIKEGLKKCVKEKKIPKSIGIDTWAVDFVLLDEEDEVIGNTVSYRDRRTEGMDDILFEKITSQNLYEKTGIQKQNFNSIYQLISIKHSNPDQLDQAKHFMMIPDYFNYLLTSIKKTEYTNATTTQLVHIKTEDWDEELIDLLELDRTIFHEISKPGNIVGSFTEEIQKEVGFNSTVILPATHDTASAVVAMPANLENSIYLSSGTWSLMGVELDEPNVSAESRLGNFTNEGGYANRFRFIKNIMGLWMIQSVKREHPEEYTYNELSEMAEMQTISSILDVNDESFFAPESMIAAVKNYCKKTKQEVPQTIGELSAVIYNSLAQSYAETVNEIEDLTDKKYSVIHVLGGGANAEYLNKLIKKYTGKKVKTGPIEATAIGNLIVQMITANEINDLAKARNKVNFSFDIQTIN